MTLVASYKTSVNEPETITDAKGIDRRLGHQTGASVFQNLFSDRLARIAAVIRNIERS
jgi:hypothetical protein